MARRRFTTCAPCCSTCCPGGLLSVEGLRARRAGLRAGLQGLGLEQGAETALLSLLDHGLRLEPSRRFSDPEALRTAMWEVQAALNHAAQAHLRLAGDSGSVRWCAVRAQHAPSVWTSAGGEPDPVFSADTRREPPPLQGGDGLGSGAGHRSGVPLWDVLGRNSADSRYSSGVGAGAALGVGV